MSKLVVVEQYTAAEADDFFKRIASGEIAGPGELGPVEPVELEDVTPANYAVYHSDFRFGTASLTAQYWAAERLLSEI